LYITANSSDAEKWRQKEEKKGGKKERERKECQKNSWLDIYLYIGLTIYINIVYVDINISLSQ
jgi:hypothetical protein